MLPGKITLKNIEFDSIIGVLPKERSFFQPLKLEVSLWYDFFPSANSDSLEKAVDYSTIANLLIPFCQREKFQTLEALLKECIELLFQHHPFALKINMKAIKPTALPSPLFCEAELEMSREQSSP